MLLPATSALLVIGAMATLPVKVYVAPFPVQIVIPLAATEAEPSGSILTTPADETEAIRKTLRKHCSDAVDIVADKSQAQFQLVMKPKRQGTDLLSTDGTMLLHMPAAGQSKLAEQACQFVRTSINKP